MDRLSRAEWELMRICWRRGRCTVREVLTDSLPKNTRDYRTVLTLMTRIADKGYLKVEKEGKTNYYTPSLPKERALRREIKLFLEDVVGSDPEGLELLGSMLEKHVERASRRRVGRRQA